MCTLIIKIICHATEIWDSLHKQLERQYSLGVLKLPFRQDFNNTMLFFSVFRGVYAPKDIKRFLEVAGKVYSNLRTQTNWKIEP